MQAKGLDVVILAGGMGTRMGPLCARIPKPLLPVMGTPFAVWQMQELVRATPLLRRAFYVVRSGMEPMFKDMFRQLPVQAYAIPESQPLGTGGAILNIFRQRESLGLSDPFLVLNGDVLFAMHTDELLAEATHAGAAIHGAVVADATRFGTLVTEGVRLKDFREKDGQGSGGIINAGLYAFRHDALEDFAFKPCSFERDIAPCLAANGNCAVVSGAGGFIDVGTPEDFAAAEGFIRRYAYEISTLAGRQKGQA